MPPGRAAPASPAAFAGGDSPQARPGQAPRTGSLWVGFKRQNPSWGVLRRGGGGGATYLPDTKEPITQGQFNLFDLTENKKEKNFIFYLAKLLFGCCFGFKTDHRTIRKK